MYTILTLYKKDADVYKELFLGPVEPVLLCFSSTESLNGHFGGSFLLSMASLRNQAGDYLEIHMEFIDHSKYIEWHDIYGEIHDSARASLDQYLRQNGITVNRYFEFPDLADPEGSKGIADFFPRNELLTPIST